jgi:MFS family permease
MSKLRQWLLFAAILLPSLACTAAGPWLELTGNRQVAWLGIYVFLGGMTVVPICLGLLANYFIKGERQRIQFHKPKRASSVKRIKKMERMLRHAHFMKRHPSFVFLFCVGALIVSGGMASAPAWGPDHRQDLTLQVMGIVLGLAYIVILILFLCVLLSKKWEPYMDASIQKAETQLAKMKETQMGQDGV